MALIKVADRGGKEQVDKVLQKAKSKKKTATRGVSSGLVGKIKLVERLVDEKLGKYKDTTLLIQTEDVLHDYITKCINNGECAIDTETTGLDPLLDKIVGFSIYTPNEKTAYVPINHISYITRQKSADQLPIEICGKELQRLVDAKTEIDMFNATFDTRVLMQLGVRVICTWDTSIGAKCLNENELEGGLKPLHEKYVLKGQRDTFDDIDVGGGKAMSFKDFFKNITFDLIPIRIGYLYAAHDAIITYELKKFQEPYLTYERDCTRDDRNGMNGVAWVFHNIEMPCVQAVVDMENVGVAFDFDKNAEFKVKYHQLLEEKETALQQMCEQYRDRIQPYINEGSLDDPINMNSPAQLVVLLYDALKIPPIIDKKTKQPIRSTEREILQQLDHPICKAILDYRSFEKLVSTYIDKLPECVNPNDNRIHAKFNQYGAKTGRFSSNNPNLQNIPSKNKEIRQMFKATNGYVLMSSDYSSQEPKCLAALCKRQGDPRMFNTFMEGKDLYSEIASKAFNRSYEDCLEFYLDENGNKTDKTNKEGKKYRTQAKSILLGVLYGRGVASVGEQLGCSKEQAQEIKDSVFNSFPAIKQFEDTSIQMVKDLGYVTTVCGRKRRLPEMQLEEFEFHWLKGMSPDDDPLDFDGTDTEYDVDDELKEKWLRKIKKAKFNERGKIISYASQDGIRIVNNGGKIAEATRQVVNSRIQGSAADLTKLAMIKLWKNERLRELGFRMLIQVHDEIIAECPQENMRECAKLLAQTMSQAAEEILEMPIKCDVEKTRVWYGEPIE